MDSVSKMGQSRDKLMSDLRVVVRDAEDLLSQAGHQASDGFKAAKAKMEASLKAAKEELEYAESMALARAKQMGHTTDDYVKAHPWQAVGMAAAVGVIVGFLISRK